MGTTPSGSHFVPGSRSSSSRSSSDFSSIVSPNSLSARSPDFSRFSSTSPTRISSRTDTMSRPTSVSREPSSSRSSSSYSSSENRIRKTRFSSVFSSHSQSSQSSRRFSSYRISPSLFSPTPSRNPRPTPSVNRDSSFPSSRSSPMRSNTSVLSSSASHSSGSCTFSTR